MALSTLITVGETQEWLPELIERAKALKINGGFELDADLGPLISPESKKRVEDLIASAEADRAAILLDGWGAKPDGYPNGNWVSNQETYAPNLNLTNLHFRLVRPLSPTSGHI